MEQYFYSKNSYLLNYRFTKTLKKQLYIIYRICLLNNLSSYLSKFPLVTAALFNQDFKNSYLSNSNNNFMPESKLETSNSRSQLLPTSNRDMEKYLGLNSKVGINDHDMEQQLNYQHLDQMVDQIQQHMPYRSPKNTKRPPDKFLPKYVPIPAVNLITESNNLDWMPPTIQSPFADDINILNPSYYPQFERQANVFDPTFSNKIYNYYRENPPPTVSTVSSVMSDKIVDQSEKVQKPGHPTKGLRNQNISHKRKKKKRKNNSNMVQSRSVINSNHQTNSKQNNATSKNKTSQTTKSQETSRHTEINSHRRKKRDTTRSSSHHHQGLTTSVPDHEFDRENKDEDNLTAKNNGKKVDDQNNDQIKAKQASITNLETTSSSQTKSSESKTTLKAVDESIDDNNDTNNRSVEKEGKYYRHQLYKILQKTHIIVIFISVFLLSITFINCLRHRCKAGIHYSRSARF